MITLQVKGYIKNEIKLTPTIINFGNIDLSKPEISENQLKRIIILEKIRGNNLKIKSIKFNSNIFKFQIETLDEEKRYKIIIILVKENLKKGKFEDEMFVETNYEKNPLYKVKLYGNVL